MLTGLQFTTWQAWCHKERPNGGNLGQEMHKGCSISAYDVRCWTRTGDWGLRAGKVLGWGFILKNDNDRLEVLFETGIRMLISNYKS